MAGLLLDQIAGGETYSRGSRQKTNVTKLLRVAVESRLGRQHSNRGPAQSSAPASALAGLVWQCWSRSVTLGGW